MTSELLIGLVLAVAPSCRTTTVAMHPKFSSEEQRGIIDIGIWSPSYTTSVYSLDSRSRLTDGVKLEPRIIIKHLPDRNNFTMDVEIKCKPSENPSVVPYILPFKELHGKTFCRHVFPFEINVTNTDWLLEGQQHKYKLVLLISRVQGVDPEFNETFSHHVKIKFAFHNAQWKLESNAIYLWSWDSAFKWRDKPIPGSKHAQYFLSSDALRLFENEDLAGADEVQTIRFFEPELMSLLSKAPQYVRRYVNVVAVIFLGGHCTNRQDRTSIQFSTLHPPYQWEEPNLLPKFSGVNANGTLTFFVYDLSQVIAGYLGMFRMVGRLRWTLCVGLELSNKYGMIFESLRKIELYNETIKYSINGKRSLLGVCHILGDSNRNVTLFARSGENTFTCPIICPNIDEPYSFYKGNMPLTNKNIFYSTPDLNGTIIVRHASNMIYFVEDLTSELAGEYSCKVSDKTAKFNVSVVSFPYFTMKLLNGKILNGSLPTRIYAIEGEGYSVKCTVYFIGVQTPTLFPEFKVKSDGKWTQHSIDAFIAAAKSDTPGSHVNLSENIDTSSRTFELTVKGVSEGKQLFNHRLLCKAAATRADAALYGLEDYDLQSGSDVHFVQRPRNSSFQTVVSDCCFKPSCNALTENCSVEIFLKTEIIEFLTKIGVEVNATLMQGRATLRLPGDNYMYDPKFAKVTIKKATGSLSSMSDLNFLNIRPVFRYWRSLFSNEEASFTVLRGPKTNATNDRVCHEDSNCLFSTEFDHQLSESLTLSSIIHNQASSTSGTFPTTKTDDKKRKRQKLTSKVDSSCLRAMPLTVIALALACTSAAFLFDGL